MLLLPHLLLFLYSATSVISAFSSSSPPALNNGRSPLPGIISRQAGPTRGPSETHQIPGTDLTLTIFRTRIINRIPLLFENLARAFAKLVDDNRADPAPILPLFDVWPASDFDLKLEVRRTVPDCADPPLDIAFLTGLSQIITDLGTSWDKTYEFTGMITDQSGGAFFTVRLFELKKVVREQRPGVVFNDVDLNTVFTTKRAILRLTRRNDLLLFLGNTASYFYYAFGAGDNRQAQLIPYSGKPYSNGRQPSRAQLDAFANSILRPAFAGKSFGRVVIVDHARSGASLTGFVRVLAETGVFTGKPFFVDLAYSGPRNSDFDAADSGVKLLGRVAVGDKPDVFGRFDLGQVGRILPTYPLEIWETPISQVANPDAAAGQQIILLCQQRVNDRTTCNTCSCFPGCS